MCVCVALNYGIISTFLFVSGDDIGEAYSLVSNCSLTCDYVGVDFVPIESNRSFTFNAKGWEFLFPV